jgi:hypothetical protein
MRAYEMPRVLRPGNCVTLMLVTTEPNLFMVFRGWSSLAAVKKSSGVTAIGSLHGNPFTRTAHDDKK